MSFLLIWTSFYEQLAWGPLLYLLAVGVGDPGIMWLLASAYSLANLAGNLVFGFLSDRLGRYRVAGAGLLGMAVTAYLHVAAGTPGLLVGARFLHGLTVGAVAPAALAGVSDWSPQTQRGEMMARVGLVIAVASMVSPPVSGRLADTLGAGASVQALMAGVVLVGLISLFLGGGPAHRRDRSAASQAVAVEGNGLDGRIALVAGMIAFALMFAQNVLFYALPLRGAALGLPAARVGSLFAAFALGAAVAFLPPLSRLSDRLGRAVPLVAGLGLAAAGLLALNAALGVGAITVSLFGYGLGFGLVFPAVSALSADAAGTHRRGMAFGILTAAFSLGSVTGPVMSRAMESLLPPFATAGVMVALGAAVALTLIRPARPPVTPGL